MNQFTQKFVESLNGVDTRRHTVVFKRFAGQRRIGFDPSVAECPKDGGSSVSVRPRWKQGAPCGNQTTIGLSSPIQVTPSPVTVTVTETPVAQPTQGIRLG